MKQDDVQSSQTGLEPLVSILVLVYNHEKYVLECLESVKSLTYQRLELIVSDDCSRDGSFELAEQWAQKHSGRFERILVVRQEKNLGLVGNLQFLFNEAKGEYLAYTGSDDVFVNTAIERRLGILQENHGLDGIFANTQSIDEDGNIIDEEFIPQRIANNFSIFSSNKLFAAYCLLNCFIPGPVLMLRKASVLRDGGLGILPANLKIEDRYIYIRLAAKGKLGFIRDVVAKYRLVQGSLSRPISDKNFIFKHCIRAYSMNRPHLHGINRWAIDYRLARNILEVYKHESPYYKLKVFLLHCVSAQLRAILTVCALLIRFRHKIS